jgi:hypothetical protein
VSEGSDAEPQGTEPSIQLNATKEMETIRDSFVGQLLGSNQAPSETPEDQSAEGEESAPTSEHEEQEGREVSGLNWYQSPRLLAKQISRCQELLGNHSTASREEKEIARADCGAGYTFPEQKGMRVVFLGDAWSDDTLVRLTGCQMGSHCRLNRHCSMHRVDSPRAALGADVVVVASYEYQLLKSLPNKNRKSGSRRKPIRVLYWREAYWPNPPSLQAQAALSDLNMGVHLQSDLQNPSFQIYPSLVLQGMFLDESRTKTGFAASLISDCYTSSERVVLIHQLARLLGNERIHQYGACGTRELPGSGIYPATKFLSKYKL